MSGQISGTPGPGDESKAQETSSPAPTAGIPGTGSTKTTLPSLTSRIGSSSAPTVGITKTTLPPLASRGSPSSRSPYVPQFSAATQLILKRIKGEPSSLSSTLSFPNGTVDIKPGALDDVRRRLVMSMNTAASMTMPISSSSTATATLNNVSTPHSQPTTAMNATIAMPVIMPARRPSNAMSAIQRVNSGLAGAGRATATPNKQSGKPATPRTLSSESKVTKGKAGKAVKPSKGKKRAKNSEEDEAEDITTPLSTSEVSDAADASQQASSKKDSAAATPTTTMTKSGRQVLKPVTYNPAAMEAATKKKHHGKRTTEQALCKSCTRMHSPASNQIVFCDGCNDGWHQLCHDPPIGDDIIRDLKKTWLCSICVAKHEQQQAAQLVTKKPRVVGPPPKVGWADRPAQVKKAYLSTLPQSELVGLIMTSLELHPDLPIFPGPVDVSAGQAPRSLFAGSSTEGLFPRADANPTGQMNFVRKVSNGGGNSRSSSKARGNGLAKGQKVDGGSQPPEDDEDDDPLAPPWPKPGHGVYRELLAKGQGMDLLEDDDDYEAISVILYDDKGRKAMENGAKV